ncbi:MAG: hypothetical protein ACOCXX_03100 [Planctomycetota bacterium]
MSIRFSCPCGRIYDVGDHLAGKQAHCQNCGRFLIVPPPPEGAPAPEPAPTNPPPTQAPAPPQATQPEPTPAPAPQPEPGQPPEAAQVDGDEGVVDTELVEEAGPTAPPAPAPPAPEPTPQSEPTPVDEETIPTADWVESDEPVENFQQLNAADDLATAEATVSPSANTSMQNTYTVVGMAVGDEDDPAAGKCYQVLTVGLWPMAIVSSAMGLLVGLVAAVVLLVASATVPGPDTVESAINWRWVLVCPAGAIFGFLVGLLGSLAFNLLAPRLGGLEMVLRKAPRQR